MGGVGRNEWIYRRGKNVFGHFFQRGNLAKPKGEVALGLKGIELVHHPGTQAYLRGVSDS